MWAWRGLANPGAETIFKKPIGALFENDFTLSPSDQTKTLNSITFNTSGGGGLMLFALSGDILAPTSPSYGNAVNVTADSTIDLKSIVNVTMGNLNIGSNTLSVTGDAGAQLTLGATTLTGNATFSPAAGTTLVLGAISGNAGNGITVAGGGTVTLGSANNFTGNTAVTGGTLQLADGSTNNIASSPLVTVGSGAVLDVSGLSGGTLVLGAGSVHQTLQGGGTVAGNLAINGGSTMAATGAKTPTINGAVGLTLNDQSIASFDLTGVAAGTGATTGLITIANGNLTINGTGLVNLTGTIAAAGNYELFAFPNATAFPTSGLTTTGTPPSGYQYSFIYTSTEVDLDVAVLAAGSAQWNAGNGSYSVLSNWNPPRTPNGPTYVATFGDGSSVPAGPVSVTVDGADTVGGLSFITAATSYTLATDGMGGHGLTLNNGTSASTISVTAGSPTPSRPTWQSQARAGSR